MKKLTLKELNNKINIKNDFKSTKEIEPYFGIIGQERALDAISSAMQISENGFNLYVSRKFGNRKNFICFICCKQTK